MKVLITGVCGYIGSTTAKVLADAGHEVYGIDMTRNDLNDISCLKKFFCDDIEWHHHYDYYDRYDAVIHLAARIDVAESMLHPRKYYRNNYGSTVRLIRHLYRKCHFIFASTAGVFDPISPYARSKMIAEDVIRSECDAYTICRFFNVAGSDGINMQIGKATHAIRCAALAALTGDPFTVNGTDYDTPDGSCVREYIHVLDIANGLKNAVENGPLNTPFECFSTGKGHSVIDVVNTMAEVTGKDMRAIRGPARPGDPEWLTLENYGVTEYSSLLTPTKTLADMCLSAYEAEVRRNRLIVGKH